VPEPATGPDRSQQLVVALPEWPSRGNGSVWRSRFHFRALNGHRRQRQRSPAWQPWTCGRFVPMSQPIEDSHDAPESASTACGRSDDRAVAEHHLRANERWDVSHRDPPGRPFRRLARWGDRGVDRDLRCWLSDREDDDRRSDERKRNGAANKSWRAATIRTTRRCLALSPSVWRWGSARTWGYRWGYPTIPKVTLARKSQQSAPIGRDFKFNVW